MFDLTETQENSERCQRRARRRARRSGRFCGYRGDARTPVLFATLNGM